MKKTFSLKEVIGDYSSHAGRRMQAPGNLRSGRNTLGARRTLKLDVGDEVETLSQNNSVLPKVAATFVEKDGRVLAVTRGSNASDLNMPGGHVEFGEDSKDAAVRELWEETGLKAEELFPVHSKVHNGYLVTTYKVSAYHGKLRPSEEGEPSWQEPEVLLRSSHGEYFLDVLNTLYGTQAIRNFRLNKKKHLT